ncbi:MAG TPA: M90 family metallopeptidase [Rhodanobacteraceae bacterium]|nr:M90 family metallopeptidase [Rhodanobacteraceae bacterium]
MKPLDWLPWRRPPPAIHDLLWQRAVAACPLAQRLPRDARERLRDLAARFLQRKRFHPVELELGDFECLLIAMQAGISVLNHGFRALRGWQTVVVYPGEFRVHHDYHDAATGVVTKGDRVLIGEAWQRGPLVLAWAAIERDLAHPWDGYNVVAHEIAHKLDMLDGPPDGVPPLPRGMDWRDWIDTFQGAYDRLRMALRSGQRVAIDPYAATNPGEFFAVASEMHFSDPARLAWVEPGVARLLTDFYGASPAPLDAAAMPVTWGGPLRSGDAP